MAWVVLLVTYVLAALILGLLALFGVRPRWLVSSAIVLVFAAWLWLTVESAGDQDWSQTTFALFYGFFGVLAVVGLLVPIWLGWGVRRYARRGATDP